MFTIKANNTICEIQKAFNTCFPFLKLGFFNPGLSAFGDRGTILLKADHLLKPVLEGNVNSKIMVTGDMPVAELEQLFSERFGLSAQVFRKSGLSWLETSVTVDWTLKRQNQEGEELSVFNGSPAKKEDGSSQRSYL